MSDTKTQLLPLLPLTQGVVLPQMVVTIALETDEAKRAGAAAADAGDRIVLVPRIDGRFARVGTIAAVESAGSYPSRRATSATLSWRASSGVPFDTDRWFIKYMPV